MYKDKDKQRQAVREATQRYRAKNGVSALSGCEQRLEKAPELPTMDKLRDTPTVIPKDVIPCDTRTVIPVRSPLTKERQVSDHGLND